MKQQNEVIKIGQLELTFLLTGDDTNHGLVLFELVIPPGAKVPVAHYHKDVDETLYGLEGITTSTVAGEKIEIGPGDKLFIPRGVVHHHDNKTDSSTKTLCILTPDSIGPAYFRELREQIQPGIPPDFKKIEEIMLKHGLIPALA
jgi:quercetin dioxygenase-like cupin family protein